MQHIMKLLQWGSPIIAVLIVGLAVLMGQLPIARGRPSIDAQRYHFTSYTYEGIQHVIFIGPNNHINELYYGQNLNSGQWWHTDLTQTATNDGTITAAPGSALVGYSDSTQHVVFFGSDGDLHEFWSTGNPVTWKDTDLTKSVTGLSKAAPKSPLVGYIWQGAEHIIYIGSDNHIDKLSYVGQWKFDDLTSNGNPCAAPGSGLASYVWQSDGSQHVIYIDTSNHIPELWSTSNTGSWSRTDLTNKTEAPSVGLNSALTGYAEGIREHVVYIDTNTHIHELVYKSSTLTWSSNDLTNAVSNASNIPAARSALASYSDSVQHIIYVDSSNHIQELWSPTSYRFVEPY